MLYCGAGIRPAADALIAAFQTQHPCDLRPSYAGGEVLLAQLSASGTGDLFMPGEESYVNRAIELGLADVNTKRIVAYFLPVIFVQPGNPKQITSLEDLTRDGLRIALGDERACAIGRVTVQLLEKNGVDQDALGRNVSVKDATVNELCMHVQLGSVDAAIVWDASARSFADAGTAIEIPFENNVLAPIPIVRLKSCADTDTAQAFIDFVASDAGKDIFREQKYRTDVPEEASAPTQ